MCGIVGRVNVEVPVDPSLIGAMCSTIEHRGPDSRGIFQDGAVGLGIQRLAVIDLETGDQPIFNEDGSVVVVLNGEIYNYVELRERARSRAATASRPRSDTEVIAHLYEESGDGLRRTAPRDVRVRALGRARADACSWRATGSARSPSSTAAEATRSGSPPSSRRSSRTPRSRATSTTQRSTRFLTCGYVPHPLSAFAALRKLPPAHTPRLAERSGARSAATGS